jgi:hypothetical protein
MSLARFCGHGAHGIAQAAASQRGTLAAWPGIRGSGCDGCGTLSGLEVAVSGDELPARCCDYRRIWKTVSRENQIAHRKGGGKTMKVRIVVIVDDYLAPPAWSDYHESENVEIEDLPKVAGMLATVSASKISGKISRMREASKK